ncbi:MAG: aldo/keto reductase [candidate division KSB1 bacterium]|nr:aldo/keto reductase [candidate division KSB1 bacterium]
MKYVRLGERGPVVSTVGFGAWAIGGKNWGPTDDRISKRALHEALDRGVTLIDTADVYGFGHSEELIAEVLAERGKGNVLVATKVGNDFYHASAADDRGYGPIRQNYEKDYLVWATEQSLRGLRLETIDILQLHSPDLDKLVREEPWLALAELKKTGKIRYAGLSVQSFKETEQAFLLEEHADLLESIQVRYNLLEREAERVLLPTAQRLGLGVIVRIPLLFGFLTGKFSRATRFGPDDHRRMNLSPEKIEAYFNSLKDYEFLFERHPGLTRAQVSLAFCLSHPACHTVIPGAKTPEQVAENCAASDLPPLSLEGLPPLDAD